jgi:nucleoid-associated protein YgaU
MPLRSPALGSPLPWRRVFLLAPFVLLVLSPCLRAQDDDVAEAARKERARKAASQQQQTAPHVYSEEDLKRAKILTPEDQARVEARKKLENAKRGVENAETLPADPAQHGESLGEIARRVRKERAAKEAAEAATPRISPFPYAMPDPSLAAAKPGVLPPVVRNAPDTPVRTQRQRPGITAQPPAGSHVNIGPRRISPFQPRPLLSPSSPRRALPILPEASAPVPGERSAIAHRAVVENPPLAPVANTPVTVERTGMRSVQVQRGDSWWKMADLYLGNGVRWTELRSLNHRSDEPPELLRQGTTVLVPESPVAKAAAQKNHVTVKKGDTLWALAREHLGHGRDWGCFGAANPEVSDYRRLAIGTVLVLPSGEMMASCRVPAVNPLRP